MNLNVTSICLICETTEKINTRRSERKSNYQLTSGEVQRVQGARVSGSKSGCLLTLSPKMDPESDGPIHIVLFAPPPLKISH